MLVQQGDKFLELLSVLGKGFTEGVLAVIGHEDVKMVGGGAAEGFVFPQVPGKQGGKEAQQGIPRIIAENIVDILKVLDIRMDEGIGLLGVALYELGGSMLESIQIQAPREGIPGLKVLGLIEQHNVPHGAGEGDGQHVQNGDLRHVGSNIVQGKESGELSVQE